jgi:hypothetical protein
MRLYLVLSSIALSPDCILLDVFQAHDLGHRTHDQMGVLEVQFLAHAHECVLPMLTDALALLPWGNRRRESRPLPK